MQAVLSTLKLSSSYYYSIEPNAEFPVSREMIEAEKFDSWEDRNGNPSSLGKLFSKTKEEELLPQIVRCKVHGYPVKDLLNSIDPNWDNICFSQRQIKAFIKAYGEKILSVLNTEEPKLPNHLIFLGKDNDRYWLINAEYYNNKIIYVIHGFICSPGISQYGFLVLPKEYI